MTREELYELVDGSNLGYACIYIGKNAYAADKIIMTDICDKLMCESVFGGFLMNCPD